MNPKQLLHNQGPDTITLNNTHSKLDHYDRVTEVDVYSKPSDVYWEHQGRFYFLGEICRGYYKSGKKKGQHCFKPAYMSGYCSRHRDQTSYADPSELPDASSSDTESEP